MKTCRFLVYLLFVVAVGFSANAEAISKKRTRQAGELFPALARQRQPRPVVTARPALVRPEASVLDRLALYVAPDNKHPQGEFLPVRSASIKSDKDVYVVVHGWAPGYADWVTALKTNGMLPLWWNTLRDDLPFADKLPSGTTGAAGGDSSWMFIPIKEPGGVFDVTPAGLAAQLLKANPNATVLLYSWIDDSATAGDIQGTLNASLSEAHIMQNGLRLASALRMAFASSFRPNGGKLHLLGHSHGSKVITVAAQALREATDQGELNTPVAYQLTLLDSPEDQSPDFGSYAPASYDAANFLWFHLAQVLDHSLNAPTPFVDNYISAFGNTYSNFTLDNPDQDLVNLKTEEIIDVNLDPIPYSDFTPSGITGQHAYAPAWYAGSATATGSPEHPKVGFLWSPLYSNRGEPFFSQQEWTEFNYGASNQFNLDSWATPSKRKPQFISLPLTFGSAGEGVDVTYSETHSAVTGVALSETNNSVEFKGTFTKNSKGIAGMSFDYEFASCGDGDQLQIFVDGYLYFVMTGSVSVGVPGPKVRHATLGLGYESVGTHNISLMLVKGSSPAATCSVKVNNFHTFTLQ